MKPMWVIVCVCVGVAIVFMSFLEMLRFPGAKKLIFPHFLTQNTTHQLIVASAL